MFFKFCARRFPSSIFCFLSIRLCAFVPGLGLYFIFGLSIWYWVSAFSVFLVPSALALGAGTSQSICKGMLPVRIAVRKDVYDFLSSLYICFIYRSLCVSSGKGLVKPRVFRVL